MMIFHSCFHEFISFDIEDYRNYYPRLQVMLHCNKPINPIHEGKNMFAEVATRVGVAYIGAIIVLTAVMTLAA